MKLIPASIYGKCGVRSLPLLGVCAVVCVWTASAQNALTVNSTTDGNGLFSYTFSLGPDPYAWCISQANGGGIQIQSYGIFDLRSPPGWNATVQPSGLITWQPSGSDPVYVGQPSLTFSVQSSSTEAITYDQSDEPYPTGTLFGVVCSLPDHEGIALGLEGFSYLGPQEVPEPSSFALLILGTLVGAPVGRFLRREA